MDHEEPPLKPLVSVCVANFNGEKVLDLCLSSVMAQGTESSVEIIVHDDCSSDCSVALIRERFPEVRLLTSEQNVGFCMSNNRMAAVAKGDYLLLLNNDTRLHHGALNALLFFQRVNPDAGILTVPQYNMTTGELLDRGMFLDLFGNSIPNTREGTRDVAMVMGSCLWISRELWQAIGGFPEWFGSIAEDLYLCCLARLYGKRVVAVDESGYDHKVGHSFGGGKVEASGLRSSLRRRALSELNKNRVIATCYPSLSVLSLLPNSILLLLEGIALGAARRQPALLTRVYLPAILGIVVDWRRLGSMRRCIQRQRQIGLGPFFRPFRLRHQKLVLLLAHGFPEVRAE
ncbi:glycosyltransferase family 2 protein [Pseudohaliea sp.]|uniref:glycosyltransferase family 2 protein n=1 Tax=Pseudohaliea sp. TaxID=2740289 RepID=UPI0032EB42B7